VRAFRAGGEAPTWAKLERALIEEMNGAVEPVLDRYVREDGTIPFARPDAMYEGFHNWPLFYLLGGDEKVLKYAHRQFDAITAQLAKKETRYGYARVVKDYWADGDWFHHSEGNYLFYNLCMADPYNAHSRERARRFAGFYLNEEPEAPNYDPEHKLIRCTYNGSKGPGFWKFEADYKDGLWAYPANYVWTQWGYGLPFYDVPGVDSVSDIRGWEKEEEVWKENMKKLAAVRNERWQKGDTVQNLAATTLVTNAYLISGRKKYREWVGEYVGAWIARRDRNDGILPDNVGPSGEIGGRIEGRWYGAHYGWTWPHGWQSIGQAVVVAAQNAVLMTGDLDYLEFPRSQLDVLISHGIEQDGKLYIPHKHGTPGKVNYRPWHWLKVLRNDDGKKREKGMKPRQYVGTALQKDGWFEFMPMHPMFLSNIWTMSVDPADIERYEKISWLAKGQFGYVAHRHRKDQGGHDGAWLGFLRGNFPGYPEKILEHNLKQVRGRLKDIEKDEKKDPGEYRGGLIQRRNPLSVEGLVQLTMGGPLPLYNCGLSMTQVRHFDPKRRRPGLPPDVGALVSEIDPKGVQLRLVNLHPDGSRVVLVQAGSYGQHRFTTAEHVEGEREGARSVKVSGPHLEVTLPPRTEISLRLGMERFVNPPSYDFPWARTGGQEENPGPEQSSNRGGQDEATAPDASGDRLVVSDVKEAAGKVSTRYLDTVKEMLASTPEDYRVEIYLGFKFYPGQKRMEKWIKSIVPLNPAGRRDGVLRRYYRRWIRRTVPYQNGVRDGVERGYFTEGGARGELKEEIPWVDGEVHGMKKKYFPDGTVRTMVSYKNDKVHGPTYVYDEEGNLLRKTNYVNGERHGNRTDYWPNGNPLRVIRYEHGEIEGTVKEFYEGGTLKKEIPIHNETRHGIMKVYDESGELEEETYWIDGDEVTKWAYEQSAGGEGE
jgi:antitoxin component YwqK of YwqJK toxin-antitoxin module